MALSIKDPETEQLARSLAQLTGENITTATKRAIEERLRRLGGQAHKDALLQDMAEIRRRYPQNADVVVIPADDVAYDDLIHVLERLRIAQFSNISLGNRTRATEVAAMERRPARVPR